MRYTQRWKVTTVVVVLATMMSALAAASLAAASTGGSLTVDIFPEDEVMLPLDRLGEVRDEGDRFEIRDRRYEGEEGAFPVTINNIGFSADEIKVTSDVRIRDGVGEHQGTIEIDIDGTPRGRITLEYRGTVTSKSGSAEDGFTIVSEGEFKVTEAKDIFDGIRAEGTYSMTIMESGSMRDDPATVTISASGM